MGTINDFIINEKFKSVISFLSILLIENSILLPFFKNSLFFNKINSEILLRIRPAGH